MARLAGAGLPVPRGFVVPGWVLEAALTRAGLSAEARAVTRSRAPALRAAVERLEVPEHWERAWVEAARALGSELAVRSSARAEDGRTRSHAGQHATVLDVFPESVPQAIRTVWASLWSDEALALDAAPPPLDGMAVLVQPVVRGTASGVLFTIHPHTGSWRELVVEAVWGRGEALASGYVTPQAWVVRRPRGRRDGPLAVVSATAPAQDRWWPPAGGPPEPLPEALRERPPLDPDALLDLCRLGLRAERALGEPLDVEWTRRVDGALVLLQARPVTAAGPSRPRREVLWTRRFLGERFPEPVTPLAWSLVEPVLSWFVAYPRTQERHLGGGPPFRLVDGRPEVNATLFRHLAFKVPGGAPPAFLLELLPPDEADDLRRRFAVLPDLRVLASVLAETVRERRWRRFAWNPATNVATWREVEARLEALLRHTATPPATPEEARERVAALHGAMRDYTGVHVVSLLHANLGWQLLEAALRAALPDRAEALLGDLVLGVPGNLTLRTNAELAELAARLSADDLDRLERGAPLSAEGAGALAAFLDRHGHRALASWDVLSPRWRDRPDLLAPLLRARPATRSPRPERHEEALADVLRAVPLPALPVVLGLVWATRRFVLLRENQRWVFDRLLDALQRTLRWLGAHLAETGRLDRPDDLALLTWPEVEAALTDSQLDLRPLLARRRAEAPGTATCAAEAAPVRTGALRGRGVVAGRVRGTVRVLRSPAEGHRLARGDVLVAHALDPSWTPLLLTAGAVVVELGGMLSHGAVVAREYGVPMIVDVPDATRQLRDGETVTVDGTTGVVRPFA